MADQRELQQVCGSATRTFTISDDGIEIDARGRGSHSSKRFPFQQFGQQKTDFEITQKRVLRYGQRQRVLMNVCALGLAFAAFAVSDHLEDAAGHMSPAAIVTNVLGWLLVVTAVSVLAFHARTIRCKRVYFQGGSLEFFFRDQRDADQVDAFLAAYAAAESAFARRCFLDELADDPRGMQRWLENLSERGLFSPAEYAQHLLTIRAAEVSPASE